MKLKSSHKSCGIRFAKSFIKLYMYTSGNNQNIDGIGQNRTIDDYNVERVREFTNIETKITKHNNRAPEIKNMKEVVTPSKFS